MAADARRAQGLGPPITRVDGGGEKPTLWAWMRRVIRCEDAIAGHRVQAASPEGFGRADQQLPGLAGVSRPRRGFGTREAAEISKPPARRALGRWTDARHHHRLTGFGQPALIAVQ